MRELTITAHFCPKQSCSRYSYTTSWVLSRVLRAGYRASTLLAGVIIFGDLCTAWFRSSRLINLLPQQSIDIYVMDYCFDHWYLGMCNNGDFSGTLYSRSGSALIFFMFNMRAC
jgi:hypothetical protein